MHRALLVFIYLSSFLAVSAQHEQGVTSPWGMQIRLGTEGKLDYDTRLCADLRLGLRYKKQTAFGVKLLYHRHKVFSYARPHTRVVLGDYIENLYGVYGEHAFKPYWHVQPTVGIEALWGTTRRWNPLLRPNETQETFKLHAYNAWLGFRWWPFRHVAINTDLAVFSRNWLSGGPDLNFGIRWGMELKLPFKGREK